MKTSLKWGIGITALVLVAAILVIAVKGFTAQPEPTPEPEAPIVHRVQTRVVEPGLSDRVTVTGTVTPGQSARLTAERRADVAEVRVAPGNIVKKDDVLVVLHSETLDASFTNTSIMLNNARANVATTEAIGKNNVESERVRLESIEEQYRNTVIQNALLRQQANEQLAATKLNSNLAVAQATTALDTAQKSYERTKAVIVANTLVANTSMQNALRTVRNTAYGALNTLNELLNVDANYRGSDQYLSRLGTRDQQSVTDAKTALRAAITSFDALTDTYETAINTARSTETALDKALVMLNFTIADPNGTLTQTVLDAYTANIAQQLTSVRNNVANIESAQGSILATVAANAAQETAAAQGVEAAQRALASAKQDEGTGMSQAIRTAEAQHAATLAQIQTTENSLRRQVDAGRVAYHNAQRSAELSALGAKNGLASTQDAADQLNIARESLVVRAPFDGLVAEIAVNLGDEVNAGAIIAIVQNPDTLKVEAAVTQADAARMQPGDAAIINGTGTGVVTAVAQSADTATKLFAVEVDPRDTPLAAGQFVELELNPVAPEDATALFVPVTAIHISADVAFVWTIEENHAVRRIVKLGGVRGDHVQIMEGLTAGTEIITDGGRSITEEGAVVERAN